MNWLDKLQPSGPIIRSLLDTDFYKFTMGQVVFHHHPNVTVRYALKCRTKGVALAKVIQEGDLRRELDAVRKLKCNTSEIRYLRGAEIKTERMFSHEYLYFFENQLELPPYELKYEGDNIVIEVEGDWAHAIYWEIPILAIVNELYYRSLLAEMSPLQQDAVIAMGITRLWEKIKILREHPEVVFIDFGTRRRFSFEQQFRINQALKTELHQSQFRGTANVYMAMQLGLPPMGTSAHEMFMVAVGIADKGEDAMREAYRHTTQLWYKFYGQELSVALPDTFGSLYHLQTMTKEEAQDWKGFRHDSGDPIWFGENVIKFYQKHGIDPRDKMLIFSDGLELDTILKLHKHFCGRIKTSFGWGTNLTNDLGIPALSLVVKPVMANGRGLVKLSDNPAKSIGKPEDIERYKKVFGYEEKEYVECKY